MKKVLITGINGFVGKYLAREITRRRHTTVIGVGHHESRAHESIAGLIGAYVQCDITKDSEVSKIDLSDVSCVINLAGLANVGASFGNPELYMRVNVDVVKVLGNELRKQNPKARMIAVSTGAVYDPAQKMPITETSSLVENGSPYTQSKIAMEKAAFDLHDKGLGVVIVRPFNHIGPGQGPGFLLPDLIEKLKQTNTNNPRILAGNLNTVRDYTDVRDIVHAYATIASMPELEHPVYNVCSGNGKSGKEILELVCANLGIDFQSINIDINPELIRPNDPQLIIGSHDRLTQETDWTPSFSLEATIKDIVDSAEIENL